MDFKRHFGRKELEQLFDDGFRLPDDFLFGVANSGFQVEGGYNGEGEPLNNWAEWEREGKVEACGMAIDFWNDFGSDLEVSRNIGLNAFRMGIEWARVQPITEMKDSRPPVYDREALSKYADIIAAFMGAGLEPVITLHHFTHPHWAGLDFWTYEAAASMFRDYARWVVEGINEDLCDRHGLRPVRFWVTLNEPNVLPVLNHVLGVFPHHRRGFKDSAAALSHLITAHIFAYDAIHELYEDKGWGDPMVSYNTFCLSIYNLDKFVTDLLLARRNGVARSELDEYMEISKRHYEGLVNSVEQPHRVPRFNRVAERFLNRATSRFVRPERYPGAVYHLYDSKRDDKLDYIGVDFYDPYPHNMLRLPRTSDFRESRAYVNAELWEQTLNPGALFAFLRAAEINSCDLPIFILESGMCHRMREGVVEARRDNATKDVFLQSYIFEAMRALKEGVNLKGYFYWTLFDNYEWGSYEPRFGLYTVDFSKKEPVRRHIDAWGTDAGESYRRIISALRSKDVDTIRDAFLRDDA